MTQEQVAERIEIDATTLGRIERGEIPYNQDFLERVALVYLCEPADLIELDPMHPDPPRLVYDRLRAAPEDLQRRAWAVLDALLRAG